MSLTHRDPRLVSVASAALEELRAISPSAVRATVLTDDGFEVISRGLVDAADGRFASMASSIQALGEAVARELTLGTADSIIIAAETGHVVQLRVPGLPVVLATTFDSSETLGKSLSSARITVNRIARELAALPDHTESTHSTEGP